MEKKFYFAYGSNMSIQQMQIRCPNASKVGIGFLREHKLIISHNSKKWKGGVISIIPEESKMIWGVIYELTSDDIQLLDKHEGFPEHYQRKEVLVDVIGNPHDKINKIQCITYYYPNPKENVIISESYLKAVEQAAKENQITLML